MSATSFAASLATPAHRRAVYCASGIIALLTLALIPLAKHTLPEMPGLVAVYQTALIIAFALGAIILLRRFLQEQCVSLLVLSCGTTFTLIMVTLQLLSFPNVFAPTRLFGIGPDTTIWLWTFWHAGPPVTAALYVLVARSSRNAVAAAVAPRLAAGGFAIAVLLAALAGAYATTWVHLLPKSVIGDDYTLLTTSGIGPAVQALTVFALLALVLRTRGSQTFLELWLAFALFLLIADNTITFIGASRNTVGWLAGRLEALASAWVIVGVYASAIERLHARAEALEDERRQGARMEALGKLTGGIAHDFNNLLTVVVGSLDFIARKPDDTARVRRMAENALMAADRGSKLTGQLLAFSRKQVLRPEVVNVNRLVRDYDGLIRRAAGDLVTVTFTMDPVLHPVHLDGPQLEACLLNLVINARDAMPNGGAIAVATRNIALAKETAALAAGDYVEIAVRDTGTGMPPEIAARVFEPFFTTKEVGRGTGLGLSQAYGFITSSGGAITVESELGNGTTIRIWLPRYAGPALAAGLAATEMPTSTAPSRGECVLVVEDDREVADTAHEALRELGYMPIAAANAGEALTILKSDQTVDIVFSDIVMPGGMNGVQLAVEAERIRPGIRVLLASGYAHPGLSETEKLTFPILNKPYRRDDLARKLKLVGGARALP